MITKYAKSFDKKEKVLNYTSNTYQLTRPSKVGEVMALIRKYQPKTLQEWEEFYFQKAYTKITQKTLDELERDFMLRLQRLLYQNGLQHFRL